MMATQLLEHAWKLYNADWIVMTNCAEVGFLTSDYPMAFDDPGSFRGGRPHPPRYLPLTLVICLYVDMDVTQSDGKPNFAQKLRGQVRYEKIIKPKAVDRRNLAVIRCAEDHVISAGPIEGLASVVRENAEYRVSNEFICIPKPDGAIHGMRMRVWDPSKNNRHWAFPFPARSS